jgi:hypothetical protein
MPALSFCCRLHELQEATHMLHISILPLVKKVFVFATKTRRCKMSNICMYMINNFHHKLLDIPGTETDAWSNFLLLPEATLYWEQTKLNLRSELHISLLEIQRKFSKRQPHPKTILSKDRISGSRIAFKITVLQNNSLFRDRPSPICEQALSLSNL